MIKLIQSTNRIASRPLAAAHTRNFGLFVRPNLYDTLGVSSKATQEEIDRAYELHVSNYYDDQNLTAVHLAHKALADPVSRDLYDEYIS